MEFIENPETGRRIRVGGPAYGRLLARGWDLEADPPAQGAPLPPTVRIPDRHPRRRYATSGRIVASHLARGYVLEGDSLVAPERFPPEPALAGPEGARRPGLLYRYEYEGHPILAFAVGEVGEGVPEAIEEFMAGQPEGTQLRVVSEQLFESEAERNDYRASLWAREEYRGLTALNPGYITWLDTRNPRKPPAHLAPPIDEFGRFEERVREDAGFLWGQLKNIMDGFYAPDVIFVTFTDVPDDEAEAGPFLAGGRCLAVALEDCLARKKRMTPALRRKLDAFAETLPETGATKTHIEEAARRFGVCIKLAAGDGTEVYECNTRKRKRLTLDMTAGANHVFASSERPQAALVAALDVYLDGACEAENRSIERSTLLGLVPELQRTGQATIFDTTAAGILAWGGTDRPTLYRLRSHLHDLAKYFEAQGEEAKAAEVYGLLQQQTIPAGEWANTTLNGLQFKRWLDLNGFDYVPRGFFEEACSAAQVENRTWGVGELSNCAMLDMKSAYLSCGTNGTGPAREWADRYGMPGCVARYVETAERLPGADFYRVSRATYPETAHEYVEFATKRHIEQKGWLPAPLLDYLADVWAVEFQITGAVVTLDRRATAPIFPRDRTTAVRYVGRCAHRRKQEILIPNDEGLARVVSQAKKDPLITKYSLSGTDVWSVVTTSDARPLPQVRSYVLAYTHIAVLEKLRECTAKRVPVYQVCTDSITILAAALSHIDHVTEATQPGEWRQKPAAWHPGAQRPEPTGEAKNSLPLTKPDEWATVCPESLKTYPETASQIVLYEGPGGSGKTTQALRLWPNAVLAGPSWEYVAAFRRQNPDRPVRTIQGILSWFPNQTARQYLAGADEVLGRRPLPAVLVVDEVGMIPAPILERLARKAREDKTQLVLCGDPEQLGSIEGLDRAQSWTKLRGLATARVAFETDYRSQCDGLKQLKTALRGKTAAEQVKLFRETLEATPASSFLEQWHPRDRVLAATNRTREELTLKLWKEHKKRYPAEPMPFRYRGKTRGTKTVAGPDGRPVEAYKNAVAWVLPADLKKEAGENWQYAAASTVYSVQGQTVNTKLWIADDGRRVPELAFTEGLVYTAVSRARRLSQLGRVTRAV